MSTVIGFKDIVKKYGDKTIIPQLSLTIENGEFFTLLGPSGCGKTTLLRMVAGFNSIEGGSISFNNKVINEIPAYKRNIGMVFQNYAIFPHMTVRQNIEYGLKQRRLSKEEIRRKTDDIMEIVQITEHADKLPERMSGGQQQRVALARAIVIHPSVLLMDEPLSNLDAKLRIEMRSAIRDIQKSVGITTVYVTHDQEEALAVSDRIAIMKDGVIQQVSTPHRLYSRPANEFVATFIGHSNILKGVCKNRRSLTILDSFDVEMDNLSEDLQPGTSVKVSVRPEEFNFSNKGEGLRGIVKTGTFLGRYVNYEIILEDGQVVEVSQDTGASERLFEMREEVFLTVNGKKINVFDETGLKPVIKEVPDEK